jgi:hypothetical protein
LLRTEDSAVERAKADAPAAELEPLSEHVDRDEVVEATLQIPNTV